jgi:hypothetical protein
MIGTPSILSVIRKDTVLVRVLPTFAFRVTENIHVVYYESIKRELKTRPTYECRYDERLKTKVEESTRLVYTGLLVELEHQG